MTRAVRPDLMLTAYALSLGFEVQGPGGTPITKYVCNADGIPSDSLQFHMGDVDVWQTSRGWRVARVVDGRYQTTITFSGLRPALEEGARNWRDR